LYKKVSGLIKRSLNNLGSTTHERSQADRKVNELVLEDE